jgi:hypothetical protein
VISYVLALMTVIDGSPAQVAAAGALVLPAATMLPSALAAVAGIGRVVAGVGVSAFLLRSGGRPALRIVDVFRLDEPLQFVPIEEDPLTLGALVDGEAAAFDED